MRLRHCLLAGWVGSVWLTLSALAQPLPPGYATARSHSGQFIVSGRPTTTALPDSLPPGATADWIRLQPTLVAMTCERIKGALLMRLGARDHWRGKITIILRPVRRVDDATVVTQTHFKDGWNYRLEMPDAMSPDRLVHTVVQLLLVEWANRQTSTTLADIPRWLPVGLAQNLLADPVLNLVLVPPVTKENKILLRESSTRGRRSVPLAVARAYFATHEPLDFEDLCWPPVVAAGADAADFRYSAELLVAQLLRLRGGGHSLAAMLDGLGRYRNWQTAFLRAYAAHFSRTLDVDKWWSLEVAHFLRRGDSLTWRPSESLRQLDAVLTVTLQADATNASPSRSTLPLAAFLKQTPPRQQEEVLQPRVRQLEALVARVSPSLVPLTQDYLKLVQTHVRELDRGQRGSPAQRLNNYAFNQATQKMVARLEALDQRRADYRNRPPPPLPST